MQEIENAYLMLARQVQRSIENDDLIALRDVSVLIDFKRLTFVEIDEENGRKVAKPITVYAAEHGSVDVMSFLLEEGCDINARDSYGNTPLMCAVGMDRIEMISFLLKQPNIQIFMKNYYGETIGSIAYLNNDTDVIAYLSKLPQPIDISPALSSENGISDTNNTSHLVS
ncbi:MAG: ankyrin repeat domain-containing protein [Alphaproteobacteria bacterium]|nr:ankyrin repeat domain-containing protein [Alphaproteobacteria bacterium]